MSLAAATRPPWLVAPHDLESIIAQSHLTILLADLRQPRNDCTLVHKLLDELLRRWPPPSTPSAFELELARHHVAVDLQRMLARWCDEGLRATLEMSFLGPPQPPPPPPLPLPPSPALPQSQPPVSPQQQQQQQKPSRKRPAEDDGGRDFRCPFWVRDQSTHVECEGKVFPNPRKLKEHIWRFTKPFKCSTCGEGFGREKTRAIHCDQRKVPCMATGSSAAYDDSAEQARDRRIERAKNTTEMVQILEEYDANLLSLVAVTSPTTTATTASEDENWYSSPQQQQQSFQYVHSPTTTTPTFGFSEPSFEALGLQLGPLDIPDIVVTENNPPMHSPLMSYPPPFLPPPMQQQQQMQRKRRAREGEVVSMEYGGYGAFGPSMVRMKF